MAFIPISNSGAHKTIPEIFLFIRCFKRITLFIMSVCVCMFVCDCALVMHCACVICVITRCVCEWRQHRRNLFLSKPKSKSLIRPTSLLMATLNVLSHHRSGSTHIPFCFALKLTIIYHLTKWHFFTIYLHDSLRISFNSFAGESLFFSHCQKFSYQISIPY